MMNDHLKSRLESLGAGIVDIQAVYAVDFGSIALDPERLPILAEERGKEGEISADRDEEEIESKIGKLKPNARLIELLKRTPNTFDIKVIDERTQRMRITESDLLQFSGDLLRLRVSLPARHQKYASDYAMSHRPPIEEFKVITDGSLFAAYAPVKHAPTLLRIGHEYRELIADLQGKSEPNKFVVIGPSPMHLTYYLVSRTLASHSEKSRIEIYCDKYDIYVLMDSEGFDPDSAVQFLFDDLNFVLTQFYAVLLERQELFGARYELDSHFDQLAETVGVLVAVSWWQVVQAAAAARIARTHLVDAHRMMVALEGSLRSYERQREKFLEEVSESVYLSIGRKYVAETCEAEISLPQTLQSAMSYYSAEILAFESTRSVIGASVLGVAATLLGAVVGASLAGMLSHSPIAATSLDHALTPSSSPVVAPIQKTDGPIIRLPAGDSPHSGRVSP
jgi:hypothetical protein